MEYKLLILLFITAALGYIEISKLKLRIKKLQSRLDDLCRLTQNENLSPYFVSDKTEHTLAKLKREGRTVEAVKELRKVTSMDLQEAKEYIDRL